ncbi:MAG TPA: G/U mismatch-specific DNA glycosylase [Actinomycetota bacterium]|nr:G/U mismatch-specific DNA glycosylase [Actinomycetota bacterium]
MPSAVPWRPTREQIDAAHSGRIPDVLGPALDVVFVGINPGLYSAAVGHHFARPGNRFWKALHGGGFIEHVLSPFEDHTLLDRGLGLTNLVERATASAAELTEDELRAGAGRLRRKVARHRPRSVAVLGVGAYRAAFGRRWAGFGAQDETLATAPLWVLPNPSGLNAHFQLPALIETFRELRRAVGR